MFGENDEVVGQPTFGQNDEIIQETQKSPLQIFKEKGIEGLRQLIQASKNTGVSLVRGIAEPVIKTAIARPMQTIESLVSKNPPVSYEYPFPEFLGGNIKVDPLKGIIQSTGPALQTSALALKSIPAIGGAMYGAGQAIEEEKNPMQVALSALGGGALGKAAGMIIGGQKLLTGRTGKFIEEKAINPIQSTINKVSESFKAKQSLKGIESEISGVESQLSNFPSKELQLKNKIRETKYGETSSISELTNNFNQANQILKENLKKETILQTGIIKKKLTNLFKDISTTYRNGIEKAENILIKQNKVITPKDYLKVVDDTITELRLKGIPEDSLSFKTLDNLKTSLENQYPNNQLTLNDVKNLKTRIYDTLSLGMKTGSKYAEIDDQVANIFLKNHGEFIGQMSPELAQLNKEFAPIANARSWAMKSFRPYNPNEIQHGANILERLAKTDTPNQTDINYLKQLEEGSGRFIGTGELKGKTTQIGKAIRLNKQSFDLAKKNLIDSTDYRINQLQEQIASIQSQKIQLGFQRESLQSKAKDLKELIRLRNRIIGIGIAGVTLGGTAMGRKILHTATGGY